MFRRLENAESIVETAHYDTIARYLCAVITKTLEMLEVVVQHFKRNGFGLSHTKFLYHLIIIVNKTFKIIKTFTYFFLFK